VTAALLEAAIAALFLEHGYEPIEAAVVAAFSDRIEYARTTHVDHKTELQEALAKSGRQVSYNVLDVEGPPHERRFVCAALVDGEDVGRGTGRSKKDAEQAAAKEALAALPELPELPE
jgi:ribonuclease III